MPAKPALICALGLSAALAVFLLGAPVAAAPATAKAPLPTVLLYPATPGDVAALVDLRTRLRLDGRVEVLTYDPESAAIQRASAEDAHPEWLVSAPATDSGRMVLARALGASFYAVVSPGRAADTTHVELVETAPAARTFDWTGTNRQFGVRAMESQVADSLAHPVNYANVASDAAAPILQSAPVAAPFAPDPAPSVAAVPAMTASPPVTAPAVVASLPAVVASAPASGPIRIVLPSAVPSVPPAPLPLLKTAPAPLKMPVQVVQAIPIFVPPAAPPPKAVAAAPVSPLAAPAPKLALLPLPALVLPKVAVVPAPEQLKKVQIAALPKSDTLPIPPEPTPLVPEPAPAAALPPMPKPTAPAAVKKRQENAEDMTAIEPLLAKGDSALDGGDAVSAIALYRQAINGAPLSVVPRLKLAQAYAKDGLSDRALDEARRALQIAPDSLPVQQFLLDLDQQTGTSSGTLIRDRAALERDPSDPAAHAALADALWNSGDLGGAEAEYKAASALAPPGSHPADAQLAQLYAAEARYDDCLAILQTGGKDSYAVAIGIVKNRAETLNSTLTASRDAFAAGKSTREQFYDDAKKLSAEAQALAEFVAQVAPPAAYRLSHLHRTLSTNLLAQESATLVTFIETGDSRQSDSIARLERAAATEMLTAQATEEKLGLWKKSQTATK